MKLSILRSIAYLPLLLTAASGQGQQPTQVQVSVDLNHPGAEIDRHIFGQFAEHLGTGIYGGLWVGEKSPIPNTHGYRKDVVDALKAIHVPVVRWPGGCFGDLYDWRDGIGPRAKRPVRINVHWGGVTDDNAFGTHEFMNFAELIGADPYVSINVGSLAPYDAAKWVEYMTSSENASLANERRKNGRKDPWQLKYIGIGNEIWGCGGNMRGEYAADINRRYTTFITTPAAMGTIKVASGPTGSRPDYLAWAEDMMRDGGRLQAMSFHYYTVPNARKPGDTSVNWRGSATGFDEDAWKVTLSKAMTMEEMVSRLDTMMTRYDPDKKVGLYIDEWGTWFDQEAGTHPGFLYQQNTLRDAEVAALTLNIFERHSDRIKMANIAQMINVLQAMILTDGPKMLLTPTYHVFDMYQPFMGATPFSAKVDGPDYVKGVPSVDVTAARGHDGKLYLALVNTDPRKAARVTTNLTGSGHGRILTAPTIDSHNSFDVPKNMHPVPFVGSSVDGKAVFDLPAKSVAVVAVE